VVGAIFKATGGNFWKPETIGCCSIGEARIRLLSRFVIHNVDPIWQGGDKNESELLGLPAMEIVLI